MKPIEFSILTHNATSHVPSPAIQERDAINMFDVNIKTAMVISVPVRTYNGGYYKMNCIQYDVGHVCIWRCDQQFWRFEAMWVMVH